MREDRVIHGSIALIRVEGKTIGKMRSISAQESYTRQDVQGLGTIYSSELPITKFSGTVSCEFMSIDFTRDGIPGAIKRNMPSLASRIWEGEVSLEDQLSIDSDRGVQIDVFKKVEDVFNPDGTIKPKAVPYAIIYNCMIESDSFNVSEGSIGGKNQSFRYLKPIVEVKQGR